MKPYVSRTLITFAEHWRSADDPVAGAALQAALIAALPDALRDVYDLITQHADGVTWRELRQTRGPHHPSLSVQLAGLQLLGLIKKHDRSYVAVDAIGRTPYDP